MAFEIQLAEPAIQDIDEAASYIADDSVEAAQKWLSGLWEVIFSLREMPTRYAIVAEADSLDFAYRSALHYSHRIIFRVDETSSTVYIVRVHHGARRPLTAKEVQQR